MLGAEPELGFFRMKRLLTILPIRRRRMSVWRALRLARKYRRQPLVIKPRWVIQRGVIAGKPYRCVCKPNMKICRCREV